MARLKLSYFKNTGTANNRVDQVIKHMSAFRGIESAMLINFFLNL